MHQTLAYPLPTTVEPLTEAPPTSTHQSSTHLYPHLLCPNTPHPYPPRHTPPHPPWSVIPTVSSCVSTSDTTWLVVVLITGKDSSSIDGEFSMGTSSAAQDRTASRRTSLCSLVRKLSAQLATNCIGGRRPKLKVPRVRRARVTMVMSIS